MANAAAPARATLTTRPGASRKLLERKQAEQAAATPSAGEALEDSFPAQEGGEQHEQTTSLHLAAARAVSAAPTPPADQLVPSPSEPESAPSDAAAPPAPVPAPASPAWSAADESALQAMLARRKAAGFVRRGPDVSAQLIRAGSIKPNPGTVMAVVVELAAEHGPLPRGRLLELLQAAAFRHPKIKPADKGWCQGYIAGGLSNGFLSAADHGEGDADPIEPSVGIAA